MESIPKDPILQYHGNVLYDVRKMYNLEKPGEMDEAIDLLSDWLKKQEHFIRKDYSREYLERIIITAKGSVERAKAKMDKTCTFRSLMPKFYYEYNTKEDLKSLIYPSQSATLPQFAEGYYRVYFTKMVSISDAATMLNFYRYVIIMWEYIKAHDYLSGVLIINDMRDVNLMDFLKSLDINDLRQANGYLMDGFGLRVKGFYFITTSKAVDALVSLLKQVFPAKIANRIGVIKSPEYLSEIVSPNIIPKEYGGNERSLATLQDEWLDVLSSKEHVEYMKKIKKAVTDENFRQEDVFNNQYLGMPGTFRSLKVD